MLSINCFTPSEIKKLVSAEDDRNIDGIKKAIANRGIPVESWNTVYNNYFRLAAAMSTLAEYNTCPRQRWVWRTKAAPSKIVRYKGQPMVFTSGLAHPRRLQPTIDLFTTTPHLGVVLALLRSFPPAAITDITITALHYPSGISEVTWRGGPYNNVNALHVEV